MRKFPRWFRNPSADVNQELNELLNECRSGDVREGEQMEQELLMAQNVMELKHAQVRQCMIPLERMLAYDGRRNVPDLLKAFTETGYSKIPIYEGDVDHIVGYVHAFDLFQRPNSIREILRPLSIVPMTMPIDALLRSFIDQKRSMAIVVDEQGHTGGMVTLEDLMEEIVGDIDDEYDTPTLKPVSV